LWGSEYGGLVQEFLQSIVRHRWDQKYLLEQFDDDEFDDLQVRRALLKPCSRPPVQAFSLVRALSTPSPRPCHFPLPALLTAPTTYIASDHI
jgi:hypothetical protein